MFLKLRLNFGFCFVSTRWPNSRLTVKNDDDDDDDDNADDYFKLMVGVSRSIRANYLRR